MSLDKNEGRAGDRVKIRGRVLEIDVSRGKTMAAWNGVPSGKEYVFLRLEQGLPRPPGTGVEIHVWFPAGYQNLEAYRQKRIEVSGCWKLPPEETIESIYEHRQRPIGEIEIMDMELLDQLDDIIYGSGDGELNTEDLASLPPLAETIQAPIDRQAHFQASNLVLLASD